MLYVRALNEDEKSILNMMANSNTKIAYRAKIILLSSQGYNVRSIAKLIQLKLDHVRAWIHRFNKKGIEGLKDKVMVRCLTKDEESMLRVMEKVGGRVGNRAKIILLSSKWYKVKEIAHILGINQVTVSYWIYRFNALGIDGIKDRVITQNLIKESLEKSIERDDLKRYERFDYIAKPEAK